MTRARHVAVVLFLSLLLRGVVHAQPKSHAYIAAGAGATDVNGGVEWIPASSRIGIGGEVGVGWVFLGAVRASYHPLVRGAENYDVFGTVGYMSMSSSEFSSHGVSVGGGALYWLASRIGLRFDAFKYLPGSTTKNIRDEERSSSRYWGVRGGAAFSF